MPVTNCTQHVLLRASFVAAAARLPICLRKGEDSPSTPAATPPLTRTRSTNGWLRVCSNADARDRKSPTGDGSALAILNGTHTCRRLRRRRRASWLCDTRLPIRSSLCVCNRAHQAAPWLCRAASAGAMLSGTVSHCSDCTSPWITRGSLPVSGPVSHEK